MSGWWAYLEEQTRREVDAEVLRDRQITAIKVVLEALRPLELDLLEAQKVVHARYAALGDRVRYRPPDPLDTPTLAARAASLPGRVVAVEALWDGDTVHDWFVVLVAVLDDDQRGEADLAFVHHRRGGPPPGEAAAAAGRALADLLGVPFHFPSPDVPDDEAPRWRTVRPPPGKR